MEQKKHVQYIIMTINNELENKITIAGELGSGKSTIGKMIAHLECIDYYSTGEILRKIASNMNKSILEMNKYAEENKSIDDEIDGFTINLGKSNTSFVMDSRMAWHFIPHSFKVMLIVDSKTAALRIIGQVDRTSESYGDVDAAVNDLMQRKESERKRFVELYSVDYTDKKNFDLILDTTISTPESLSAFILDKYLCWKKNGYQAGFWISPKRLMPAQHITMPGNDDYKVLELNMKMNGYDESCPITVIKKNDNYYILDGHKRTSVAIHLSLEYVPILLLSDEDNEKEIFPGLTPPKYIETTTSKSLLHDWEDAHGFRFMV